MEVVCSRLGEEFGCLSCLSGGWALIMPSTLVEQSMLFDPCYGTPPLCVRLMPLAAAVFWTDAAVCWTDAAVCSTDAAVRSSDTALCAISVQ